MLILFRCIVPYFDSTEIWTLKEVLKEMQQKVTKIILSCVSIEKATEELTKSRVMFMVGRANVKPAFPEALERAKHLPEE